MERLSKIEEILQQTKINGLQNYVIPGLSSHLIQNGKVRLFENERTHQEPITPHSHRFDFACLVLSGEVCNIEWRETTEDEGDLFAISELSYFGEIGEHAKNTIEHSFWYNKPKFYEAGDIYFMRSTEIHSIQFGRNTKVLFFEGVDKSNKSVILEPVVGGKVIPTYQKLDYMFQPLSPATAD